MSDKKFNDLSTSADTDEKETMLTNPDRREALGKLVKYTPPAMITLLTKDSAWAQISGGPPPPPSDVRLKADIEYLGVSGNGHKLYSFRYQNDDARIRHVGVMAQEVLKVHPDAVVTRPDGYYAVHYEKLGLTMTTYDQWQRRGLNSVQ